MRLRRCAAIDPNRSFLRRFHYLEGRAPLGPFGQALPKQIVEVGIAEQNLVGIAAGLGSCGKKVFAVSPACFLTAAHLAETAQLNCRVLSLPTIKPLDAGAVLAAARECRAVVTVEEHMVHGGLWEAVAALMAQNGIARPFRIVGIPDEYTVIGSQADIFRHYGITMEGLAETARSLMSICRTVGQVSDLPAGGSETRPTAGAFSD